ncbi:hypothetical protein, conserved [Angomonas deanei]|uniref:Uncharacterized protein n=1 Tax=Angomonas deanei TaxID=59799 RepID=A0A7G2CBL3_9TRYP|nr:hypothetical protein, conserved [Angomonas deanei]
MGHGDPNNHYPLYSEMQEPANHPYSVQVIPDHVIQPTHDGEPPIEPIVGSLSESPRYSAYDAQSPFHQHSPKEQPRYSAYDAQSPVHQYSPKEQPRYSAYDAQSPVHQPKEQPRYSAYDAQSPVHQQSPSEQPRYSAYDAQSPVHQHSSNQLPLTSYEEQPSHPYQSSQHSNHSNMIDLNDVLPEGDEHYTELLESPPDSSDDNERSDNRSLREGSPPGSHPVPMNQIPENLQHGYNPPMAFPQPNGYNPMPMQGGYTPQVPLPQLPFFAGQPYSENAGPRASSAGTQKEPQYRFTPSLYAPSAQQTTANLLAQVNELERQLNRLNQAGRLPNSAPVNRDEEFLRQMGDPRKNPVASGHHLTPMDDRRPSRAVPRSSVSQGSKPPSAGKRRKSHKNQPSEQYDDDEVEHRRKQRSRSAPEKRHHSISLEGRRSAGAERRPSAHERRPSARPSPERRQSAPSPDNAPFDPTTTQSYQRAASPINKSGMTSSPTPGYEEDSRHSTPVPVRVLDSDSSQGIPTPVPQAGPIRVVVPGHAYKVPSSAPAPIRIAPK